MIFLSEAFTRPKVMRALGKAGFTQSYTYFTWRNFKEELTEYLEELTRSEVAEYFRGNFFVNTPDILPEVLQRGGPPAFRMRAALAATLSSVWGIYSGLRALRGDAPARHRGVPGLREVRDPGARLERARQPLATTSRGSTRSAARIRRSTRWPGCASTRRTARTCSSTASSPPRATT